MNLQQTRQITPRVRRVWRASGPAVAALTALLACAAGWPAAPRPAAPSVASATTLPKVAPLGHLTPVALVAVSTHSLPASALPVVRHLPGVRAALAVDAARVHVNGRSVAVLGVAPSRFRSFAAKPTARDSWFWRSVAAGNLGISYEMGKQGKLSAGATVAVAGRHVETMPVGPLRTVGIGGVNAVVSDAADSWRSSRSTSAATSRARSMCRLGSPPKWPPPRCDHVTVCRRPCPGVLILAGTILWQLRAIGRARNPAVPRFKR